MTTERSARKIRTGVVVSDKRDKTVTVEIVDSVRHKIYQKTMKSTKKLQAHDETNDARLGDVVRIVECRPLSKLKHWQLKEILRRAPQVATDLTSIGIEAAPAKRPEKKKK